ncbi:hypothetical protein GCM10027028_60700 [Streptomyces sundarbansensis]
MTSIFRSTQGQKAEARSKLTDEDQHVPRHGKTNSTVRTGRPVSSAMQSARRPVPPAASGSRPKHRPTTARSRRGRQFVHGEKPVPAGPPAGRPLPFEGRP